MIYEIYHNGVLRGALLMLHYNPKPEPPVLDRIYIYGEQAALRLWRVRLKAAVFYVTCFICWIQGRNGCFFRRFR